MGDWAVEPTAYHAGMHPAAHLHTDAVRVLTGWAAPDPGQEQLRLDYLAHLAQHPDGVLRSGPPQHLTASCLVFDPSGTRTLLTHHAKGNFWVQLGGHLEVTDTSLVAAARREAREESGLPDLEVRPDPVHLDRHALPAAFGRCDTHLDVRYLAVVPADAVPVVSVESHGVAWFPLDVLPTTVAPDLRVVLPRVADRHVVAGLLRVCRGAGRTVAEPT